MPKHLLSGHAQFRAEYFTNEAKYLQHLASEGQKPSALYIGCSDSRVIPELLTSSAPGEIFVVRNIANLVPTYSEGLVAVGAAIEYALEVLKVPDVIVCGHYGCGGVRAALDGRDALAGTPSLHRWLSGAEPAARRAKLMGLEGEALFKAAVEENVLYQMEHLISFPIIERALAKKEVQLHGWVYDIAEGGLLVYDVKTEEFLPYKQVQEGA
jgi:carbonic anhydrase